MVENNSNQDNQPKVNNRPLKYLYRYFTINENNFNNIKNMFINNELFFQAPRKFNDPFDCRLKLQFNGTKQQWRQFLSQLIKRHEPSLNRNQRLVKLREMMKIRKNIDFSKKVLSTLSDDIGTLCLSEIKDDLLMWSHYSNGHKGFCLEFSYSKNDPFFGKSRKVIYKKNYPSVNFFDSSPEEQLDAMIFTKARFWKYEKEWRIVDHEHGRGLYRFPIKALTGVIFGENMEKKHKKNIKEWIQMNDFTSIFYQASIKDKEYGLNIEKLK